MLREADPVRRPSIHTAVATPSRRPGLFWVGAHTRDPDLQGGEGFSQSAAEMTPMRNPYVEPADVSEAIGWLVSPTGRFDTGVALPVDGGTVAPDRGRVVRSLASRSVLLRAGPTH